jgi:ADP-heptose:LPS heptosyltransferase
LLAEMDLLVSNDSGPVHMAVAVGTPSLVLFGPTDPVRTGPYGEGHRILQAGLACQPCLSRKCSEGEIPCLAGITPREVAQAARNMLA